VRPFTCARRLRGLRAVGYATEQMLNAKTAAVAVLLAVGAAQLLLKDWEMRFLYLAGTATLALVTLALYLQIRRIVTSAEERIAHQQADSHDQLQALIGLYAVVSPRSPLPPLGGYAITPEFAGLLVSLVRELKPRLIVEASSGVSTLLSGYCLEQLGAGSVVSLEHEEKYYRLSSAQVRRHGLDSICRVLHAPLKPYALNGKEWLWYDIDGLADLAAPIDLLVIDGPPQAIQHQARYPALPLLYSRLSPQAVIVLDDADREDETQLIRRWLHEYPEFEYEHYPHFRGTVVLRHRSSPS